MPAIFHAAAIRLKPSESQQNWPSRQTRTGGKKTPAHQLGVLGDGVPADQRAAMCLAILAD